MTEAEAIAQRVLDQFHFLVIVSDIELKIGETIPYLNNIQGVVEIEAQFAVTGPATKADDDAIADFLGVPHYTFQEPVFYYKVAAE